VKCSDYGHEVQKLGICTLFTHIQKTNL